MCGIHLLVNKGNLIPSLQKMLEASTHRGPDHAHFEVIEDQFSIGLAANRLKIIDLSDAANQPIWSIDRKHLLVWNGEVYNHQDLRNILLDKGIAFRSHADSEVLLYWLSIYGIKGLSRVKGMYSVIWLDLENKCIHVVRDSSGQKPLYFHRQGNEWVFSSEVKGVLAALPENQELDKEQFEPYFYSRHAFPHQTFTKDVHQVLPGNGISLNLKGEMISEFQISFHQTPISPEHTFEDKLKDAVLNHFQADVPVGTAMSGGADSSLLYALWYEETGIPLNAYTLNFEKKDQKHFPDFQFAKKLIKKYPAQLHEIQVTPERFLKEFPHYIEGLDQPVGDSAGFLTWLMAKEAKQEVKVLISGAGADELFGGYNRHKAFQSYLQKPAVFNFLKQVLPINLLPSSYQKLISGIEKEPNHTFLNYASLTNLPESLKNIYLKSYPTSGNDYLDALEWDRRFYLVQDVLKIHDQSCMAHGIEGRAPYLDEELLQFRNHYFEKNPSDFLGKKWIKDALIKRNLKDIANRKKMGFGLPFPQWLKRNIALQKEVKATITDASNLWKPHVPLLQKMGHKAIDQYLSQNPMMLWNLYLLSAWLKVHHK